MMTTESPTLKRRNALKWAGMGFVTYGLVMLGAVALLHHGSLGVVLASSATVLAPCLLLAATLAGLGQRNRPFDALNIRNFLIWTGAALALFALIMSIVGAISGPISPRTMGVSAMVAQLLGLGVVFFAILGFLHVAAAHARDPLISADQREFIIERERALIYSLLALVAMGLTLVVLSLAGPHGILSPVAALAAVLFLVAVRAALAFATRPLLDELSRTISRETGHAAFNLIVIVGGAWAMLSHLGFVQPPAPLDWLTMFTVFVFAASFIAAGRRGLIESR